MNNGFQNIPLKCSTGTNIEII